MNTRTIKSIENMIIAAEIERKSADALAELRSMSRFNRTNFQRREKPEQVHDRSKPLNKSFESKTITEETSLALSENIKQSLDKLDHAIILEQRSRSHILIGAITLSAAALTFGIFALKSGNISEAIQTLESVTPNII